MSTSIPTESPLTTNNTTTTTAADISTTSGTTATPAQASVPTSTSSIADTHHSSCSTTDFLTWKNPIKTGKVFGSLVFGLIVLKTVNLFNIFFHLAYIGLLISAAAEYSGKLITGKGFLANFKPTGKLYAKRFNDEVLPELANFNVHLEESFNKIVYSHDIETTLKAAGISYILYKLTSWFSLYTLIFIFVVLIFTVPVIYKTYKKEIDAAVADITKTIKTKSAEFTEKAHKAAGPHIDTLIKKTGPIGSFIQSKLPVRTAGSTVGDSNATSYGTDADKSIAGTTSATGTSSATANSTTVPVSVPAATSASSAEPISTGHSTGASQFPSAPTSGLHPSTVEDVIKQASEEADEFADTTQESFKPTLH